MKTYQDVETFMVRIHDMQFEEKFTPLPDFSYSNLQKVKVFLCIDALKRFAAGRMIQYVPGKPGESPSVWYVRIGFGKYLPCSTNGEMDKFTRSIVIPPKN